MIKGKFLYKNPKCNKSLSSDREFEQCFVWKADDLPIYIMDNHRAALWCWLSEVNPHENKNLKLFHIDNHDDMSPKGFHCQCSSKISISHLTIVEYLNKKHDLKEKHYNCEENENIFSYENFLRFFAESYRTHINPKNIYITKHHWETKPIINPLIKLIGKNNAFFKYGDCAQLATRIHLEDLFELLDKDKCKKWIIDLDLDYFYNEITKTVDFELAKKVIEQIKIWNNKKKILVVTIAWSPEYLIDKDKSKKQLTKNGWLLAKKLNDEFCNILVIDPNDFKNV